MTNDNNTIELLREELNRIMNLSIDLKKTMDASKTKIKKDLYYKRLQRNNYKIVACMEMIEKLSKSVDKSAEV